MYVLRRIYGLTRISYHIFHMYIISHVLAISHALTDFQSHTYLRTSDIPCDVTPYGSNAVYLTIQPYMDLYDLCGLQSWNLSTVPGVTPTHSCGHISEWGQNLMSYTYFLVRITPMIRCLNFLNRFPWSALVIKSLIIQFLGHHSTVAFFLFILSVTKKNRIFVCLVIFLPEVLLLFSSSMSLWFYC